MKQFKYSRTRMDVEAKNKVNMAFELASAIRNFLDEKVSILIDVSDDLGICY